MTYTESLKYLNSFINYEQITHPSPKRAWNLRRMHELTELFDHPEKSFTPVLIAGTKGKGSTGFFLESILNECGVPVGFSSSPHFVDVRERIRVNAKMVSKKVWTDVFSEIQKVLGKDLKRSRKVTPTYFEILTLAAMLVFKKAKVKIAVFEVGLGGRLDASNVMDAPLTVITPIHYDHEAFLGNTLTEIAGEKAAIIRKGAAVVVSPQLPEPQRKINAVIKKQTAIGLQGVPLSKKLHKALRLPGDYQRMNASTALRAAHWLGTNYGFQVPELRVKKALARKGWHGRFQIIKTGPEVILDVAHNPASARAFVSEFKRRKRGKCMLIFGVAKDKRSEEMLAIFSEVFRDIILVKINNPRSQQVDVLIKESEGKFEAIFPVGDTKQALALAKSFVGINGTIAVVGSFYLVGEVMKGMTRG